MQYTSCRRIQCHFDTVMVFPPCPCLRATIMLPRHCASPVDCELSRAGTKDVDSHWKSENHPLPFGTTPVWPTDHLCHVLLGDLCAFGFLGFCLLFKLIPAPRSAEGLTTDGGAWSCEYSLHIRNAGINAKLICFWTFFQDLCNDGGVKMVYCQLSCRFLTHMTVLYWLYQSLNKKCVKTEGLQEEEKR